MRVRGGKLVVNYNKKVIRFVEEVLGRRRVTHARRVAFLILLSILLAI